MKVKEETKEIRAVMIIDVLGKPPEHLTETLNNLIDQIDKEKGVSVKEKKINEPRELEKERGFYTNFAEIEVEVEAIENLVRLMFSYMPAHVEIIEPESIVLSNNVCSEVLSEIIRRLHGYDEVARITKIEKNILEKKLRETLKGQKEEKNGERVENKEEKKNDK